MPNRQPGPPPAEIARTAFARAKVATLTWTDDEGCFGSLVVKVDTDVRTGDVVVYPDSRRSAPSLCDRRWATLTVAGGYPFESATVVGRLRVLQGGASREHAGFRLAPLSVFLNGSSRIAVPVAAYRAASPDPLSHDADQLLDHLARSHADDLLQCVRAHGLPTARFVVPRNLDCYGLDLAVVTLDGVLSLKLAFPASIETIDDALRHLRVVGRRPIS